MKRLLLTLCLASTLTAAQCVIAQGGKPIDDASLGLSKGSVFDVPTPQPFAADGKGAGGAAQAAYAAPPLVPHETEAFMPVTADKNACLGCHDKPGAKKKKGEPTPVPKLHYAKSGERLSGDYYNCPLCHSPAANVKDLVGNRAPKPKR